MIRAILFDFGGVIYKHPKAVIPRVLSDIFNQSENKINEEYQKYKKLFFAGKISSEKLLGNLKKQFPVEKMVKELEREWLVVYGKLVEPDEGIMDILKDLKSRYKLYLFTNTVEMNDRYNSKTGIYDYFDELFCSFKIGLVKPDPKAYQFVISRSKFRPEEYIFIDDQEENLLPARKIGMKTILFDVLKDDSEKLKRELRKTGIKI